MRRREGFTNMHLAGVLLGRDRRLRGAAIGTAQEDVRGESAGGSEVVSCVVAAGVVYGV